MPIAHKYHTTTHGNAAFADADIIAVAESWALHIELTFADMTYGTNAWFNGSQNITYTSYIQLLEHVKNETQNHIPIGLYYDLIDGINTTEIAGDGDWGTTNTGTINDNVSGLTNAQLFNLLDANTTSPTIFIQRVNSSGIVQFPNTTSGINNLFNSY